MIIQVCQKKKHPKKLEQLQKRPTWTRLVIVHIAVCATSPVKNMVEKKT